MVLVPGRDDPKETLRKVNGKLLEHEVAWRDKYAFLISKGYTLRPPLCTGWIPSWTTEEESVSDTEDEWLSVVSKN